MDIYSFAMTAYEILTGNKPYTGINNAGQLTTTITSDLRPHRPGDAVATKWLLDPIWNIMESCWTPKPKSRPSIDAVHKVFLRSAMEVDGSTTKDKSSPHGGKSPAPKPVEKKSVGDGFLGIFRGLMRRVRSLSRKRSAEQQPGQ